MILDSTASSIEQVSVHHIGNASQQEGIIVSEAPLDLTDEKTIDLLGQYFLSNFTVPEYYAFTFSNEDFTLNPVYKFVKEIFDHPEFFHENSINIAKHLYDATQHPNIKAGDLYIARFADIGINSKSIEVIGIFKSETKESYLKLKAYANQFDLTADEGINTRNLDKGCLVLKEEEDAGYKVLLVDNANKSDAQFWKNDFLNVRPHSDSFYHTHQFMNLTRQYVSDQLQEEFSVSRADQIDLLNRSMDFFKSKDQFNQAEFEAEVLGDAGVIESFRKYEKQFQQEHHIDVQDQFAISVQAVKRQARVYKSV
jgi:hypothetical protein